MAKDGWEKFRYICTINDYNMIIEECQKMYDEIPVTSRLKLVTCLSTIKKVESDLEKTQPLIFTQSGIICTMAELPTFQLKKERQLVV